MKLAKKKCIPCTAGTPPLKGDDLKAYVEQLDNNWKVVNEHQLEKEFAFKNFKEAQDFTNAVAEIAEEENHHPDILLRWGKVRITLWTHAIGGLSESDFIVAAKIDQLSL